MRFLFSFLLVFTFMCPSLAFADTADKSERERVAASFIENFEKEDFSELNVMAAKYRSSAERTASGDWELAAYYDGVQTIATRNDAKDYWHSVEAIARKWIAERPSPAAHIVYAMLLINHAKAIHGEIPDESVPPDSRYSITSRLDKASAVLNNCKDFCDADPEWYVAMIVLAKAQNWDASATSQLYSEAVKAHPYYDEIYYHIVDNLRPADPQGSYAPIEDFANNSVLLTGDKYGYGMYARIYAHLSEGTAPKINIFETTLVSWRTMKKGIADIIEHYPDQWNLSRYAYFACLNNDGKETHDLTDRIKVNLIPAWNGEDNKFETCKRMSH